MKDEAPTHTRVSPTAKEKSSNNQRTNWKLKLRKEEINKILFRKRMQNLGQKPTLTQDTKKKKKKARFKKISCWYCGKNGHKMNTCTFKREASIKSRLAKLEKHYMKMKTQIKQYQLQKQKIEQYFNSRAYRLKQKKKKEGTKRSCKSKTKR